MGQLWVVGSLNMDLIVGCGRFPSPGETILGESFQEIPGGKGGNQAVAIARLGGHPRMVGALGDDARGAAYRNLLTREGVDTEFVHSQPMRQTGLALIEVAGGENRIIVVPGANEAVTMDWLFLPMAKVLPGDIVLFQLEIPLTTVFEAIRFVKLQGATVILDPAPAVPLTAELLALVDYLTPNETEARIVAGLPPQPQEGEHPWEAAQRILALGCPNVVQKAGGRGSFLVTAQGGEARPAFPVAVADTVGAGDAFNGGFAFALSQGKGAAEALAWGNAAGALSTRAPGAQGALPTRAELAALLGE